MSGLPKQISASMFGGILVCFLLPFAFVSCGDMTINVSGVEMALGKYIENADQRIDPVLEVQLALACAVAGLIISFLAFQLQQYVIMGLSAAGAVLLLIFKGRVDAEGASNPLVTIGVGYGFWLALLLYIGVLGLSGYFLYQQSRSSAYTEEYV